MSGIFYFTLLSPGYLCITINVLNFDLAHLGYLETVGSFWVLLLRFVRWDWNSTQTRDNFPPLLGENHTELSIQCPVSHVAFQTGLGEGMLNWL
jgi:hypothetical protein